jgi:hypothetical protein
MSGQPRYNAGFTVPWFKKKNVFLSLFEGFPVSWVKKIFLNAYILDHFDLGK